MATLPCLRTQKELKRERQQAEISRQKNRKDLYVADRSHAFPTRKVRSCRHFTAGHCFNPEHGGGQKHNIRRQDARSSPYCLRPEQIQNLFRLDRQHSRRGTSGEQGSGLGLIVCRELLQKHGSELQVESEEGKEAGFGLRHEYIWVFIPIKRTENRYKCPLTSPSKPRNFAV